MLLKVCIKIYKNNYFYVLHVSCIYTLDQQWNVLSKLWKVFSVSDLKPSSLQLYFSINFFEEKFEMLFGSCINRI